MATRMNPPYSSGVVEVDDKQVKDYEKRGFTAVKVADKPATKAAPRKSSKS